LGNSGIEGTRIDADCQDKKERVANLGIGETRATEVKEER